MDTTIPTIEEILTKAKVQQSDVIALYQWGSRIFGVQNEQSDWDYILIVNNDCSAFSTEDTREDYLNIHTMNLQEFSQRLKENELQSLMAVFLPDQFILIKPTEPLLLNPIINLRKVMKAQVFFPGILLKVHKEASRHFHTGAKRLFNEKEDLYRCKKWITYAFRDWIFGLQLLEHKKIVDYTAANEIYHSIMKETSLDWNYYQKKYDPLYYSYKEKFDNLLDNKENVLLQGPGLKSIKLLQNRTPEELKEDCAIHFQPHETIPTLTSFFNDPSGEANFRSDLYKECLPGIVLEQMAAYQWRPICYFHPAPIPFQLQHLLPKKTDSYTGFAFSLGLPCYLYFFQDKWRVATPTSPDAREKFHGETVEALFWKAWNSQNLALPAREHQVACFCFILQSCKSSVGRLLCEKDSLTLVAVRNVVDDREIDIESFSSNWPTPDISTFANLHLPQEAIFQVNPFLYESIVVCDRQHIRIKFSHPLEEHLTYLLKHPDPQQVTSAELKRLLDFAIRLDGPAKLMFLKKFPHWAPHFQTVDKRYMQFCAEAQILWDELKLVSDARAFSEMVAQEKFKQNKVLWFKLQKDKCALPLPDFLRMVWPLDAPQKLIKLDI